MILNKYQSYSRLSGELFNIMETNTYGDAFCWSFRKIIALYQQYEIRLNHLSKILSQIIDHNDEDEDGAGELDTF